ncbi:Adenosylmethionine-8-amino-7-oxononanoate aminotransferase [Botrimarina colliarenosi]|uniref:Adenosylmethionine-8-amino-7-oxononanoate aminotransferase n=1 Tax=Botrimarina colliarenosi TaxID=2528001 RepID=A0A5C6AMH3_9BACT|nr:aminotransferase class III-fold pyridoxal phosphate-dependent enzyme [Botrimarina colliarenosi]TWU00202.1 Adenosylmethionine-8-amino-7-oxononanoate aminotransferase [Botrimarina colliarenosi]
MTTPTNDQLCEWDRAHYWHSFTPMADYEPWVIARAEGSTLYDIEGKAYLDAASSMWCAALGHNHPRVSAAVVEQLGRMAHCTSLGMGADVAVRLAKRLADLAPGDLQHVFFSSDGSSAVEVAMKQALQYWRQCERPQPAKTKYLAFGEAYHGDTIGATAVGGIGRYHDVFGPILCEVIRVDPPDSRKLPPPGGEGWGGGMNPATRFAPPPRTPPHQGEGNRMAEGECAAALARVEAVLAEQADTIAAVIVEPLVQCAAGMLMHPPGFLSGLRQLCDKHDVLLIADEVAVGFGRTGKLFACNHEEVVPDFLCLGKHLTAGYVPMAATLTTPRLYEAFLNRNATEDRTFWHGHTYSGNALAAAAAMATLDEFESGLLDGLPARIAHLGERLCHLAADPLVEHARQRGMIAAFNLTEPIGRQIGRYAMDHGVWLRAKDDLVYVMPPLNIEAGDLDRIFDVISEGLESGTADGRG